MHETTPARIIMRAVACRNNNNGQRYASAGSARSMFSTSGLDAASAAGAGADAWRSSKLSSSLAWLRSSELVITSMAAACLH